MKIDHVHFYVEDAKAWRDWFVSHLGFQVVADSAIPPTLREKGSCIPWGVREDDTFHTCTQVVKSGPIYFLLSSPLLPTSPVAEFLRHHPPGVADIAFAVENVEEVILLAQAHGAKVLQPIQQHQYGQEYIKWGKIAAWGSLSHTLIERGVGEDKKSPLFSLHSDTPLLPPSSFTAIDHIVLNVDAGDLERAVTWYEKILDFQQQQTFNIQTARSALYSQVIVSRNGGVQLPINEPASANSQIQEFLNVNRGAGIQHIALRTRNIVHAIAQFRANGLCLLPVSKGYYSQIRQRKGLPLSPEELNAIAQQEILVDWQEDTFFGSKNITPLLLQIFTQPIFGQPTFFFEFIERRDQAQGFGEGNFRALFAAIENEQIKRGSLQDFGR
ncbi:4-hydroxyphenylpyruvate dioxygenase [Mastigocladopsis repens]|uniref:4-hydroxyphenylpyruvate dioxygenase n=1 Tax=Mastigocladopsis repens TaxID=221287 RepID=UPI00030F7D40|nr:4-hydroxyphenylpyruvate dioxygenase [Mastigocladopsis repens]